MKKDIKKRIEDRKDVNYTGYIFSIFILFIVICGALFIYLKKDTLVNNLEIDKKDKNIISNKYEDINVSNSNVINLFNNVHSKEIGGDKVIYTHDKLSVDEMDLNYKYSLASNLYDNYAVKDFYAKTDEITAYVNLSDVKNSYEVLFGEDTFELLKVIPYSCTEMDYDVLHERFVTTNQVCGGKTSFNTYEKIISAKKNDKELLITSSVLFASSDTLSICKDYNCMEVIGNYASNSDDSKYFMEYIDKNIDKLDKYTYKYELGNDGFYYYKGFERTKD